MKRWLLAALVLGVWLPTIAQQPGTETTCPPQFSNSFCVLSGNVYAGVEDISSNIAFSPDGQLVATAVTIGADDIARSRPVVRVWQVTTGQLVYELSGHVGTISSVHFSPDGRLLATSSTSHPSGGAIKLWEVASGREVRTLSLRPGEYNGLRIAFSPNGRLLATVACNYIRDRCDQNDVILWDVATGREIRRIAQAHRDNILSLVFIADELLATSSLADQDIKIWQVSTGRLVQTLSTLDFVTKFNNFEFFKSGLIIAISPNRQFLVSYSIRSPNYLLIWDGASGQPLGFLRDLEFVSLSFSPNGQFLAGSRPLQPLQPLTGNQRLQIWRVKDKVEDWQVARTLVLPFVMRFGLGYVLDELAFSPKGDLLAIGVDNPGPPYRSVVQLWYIGDLK